MSVYLFGSTYLFFFFSYSAKNHRITITIIIVIKKKKTADVAKHFFSQHIILYTVSFMFVNTHARVHIHYNIFPRHGRTVSHAFAEKRHYCCPRPSSSKRSGEIRGCIIHPSSHYNIVSYFYSYDKVSLY